MDGVVMAQSVCQSHSPDLNFGMEVKFKDITFKLVGY